MIDPKLRSRGNINESRQYGPRVLHMGRLIAPWRRTTSNGVRQPHRSRRALGLEWRTFSPRPIVRVFVCCHVTHVVTRLIVPAWAMETVAPRPTRRLARVDPRWKRQHPCARCARNRPLQIDNAPLPETEHSRELLGRSAVSTTKATKLTKVTQLFRGFVPFVVIRSSELRNRLGRPCDFRLGDTRPDDTAPGTTAPSAVAS